MKPVIEVRNVSKAYVINHQKNAGYGTLKDDFGKLLKKPLGKSRKFDQELFWALKDISFEVNKGEIFGIIGKNGSGKSTLLKTLSRIVVPTKGSITMRGRTASLLEVGTGFHPELSGRENIYFNGSMLGMSRQEITRKFQEIVDFSEVEKFIDTPVKFYSSGMYVRLAFSVAAHLEPDILILDEVLSVGDAGFQKKSLAKIVSTMKQGATVLFVSHGMGAVQQLCSNGILLEDGHITYSGPADELTARYMDIMRSETTNEDIIVEWKSEHYQEKPNDFFTLNKLSVRHKNNELVKKPIKSSDTVDVVLDIDIIKPEKELLVGYAIYKNRTLLYFSYIADQASKNKIELKKGNNVLRGEIPAYLLNEGDYRVAIVSSIHNQFWIHEINSIAVPAVNLTVEGGLIHAEYWSGARDGFLAPNINWKKD